LTINTRFVNPALPSLVDLFPLKFNVGCANNGVAKIALSINRIVKESFFVKSIIVFIAALFDLFFL
jgi:hypothetical protein